MATLSLPTADRKMERYTTGEPFVFRSDKNQNLAPKFNRVAYAAAHVVADPLTDIDPWLDTAVDWEKTIAFRNYLWDLGLGVAEAMDTAQRGGGLDWPAAKQLIRHSLEAAKARPGVKICCGVGTDHLDAGPNVAIDDVVRAYEEQIEAIEAMGGRLVLMASRALARAAKSPDDYAKVYGRILAQVREPVIIHWLGEMFDPALAGYWGSADHTAGMATCLDIIGAHAAKVDGVKVSLLSREKEIDMRRKLPAGVRMYTGDDFNYAELIAGDEEGYSAALLAFSTPLRRRRPPASRASPKATCRVSMACWSRRCRCRATSSRRRRVSTKPASYSWPGSTACRITSSWSAGRRARARSCISPSCFASPTRRACCTIPSLRRRA